jgi:integrase/recombinase XerD
MEQETIMQHDRCLTQPETIERIGQIAEVHCPAPCIEITQNGDIEKLTFPSSNKTTALSELSSGNQNISFGGYDSQLLHDAKLDFILSRNGMNCSKKTINWYQFMLGKIISWLEQQNVLQPSQITSYHVRFFLSEMVKEGHSDSYIHAFARVFRTFCHFLLDEGYIEEKIRFPMPKLAKKRMPVLNEDQVQHILKTCIDKRDRALILLMVDSGLRRNEVIALNWGDIDLSSGIVRVEKGKGGKARSVIIGIGTRRALLKYRGEIISLPDQPVIQTRDGKRFTPSGLRSWLLRISERAGIHITPHTLRRTFATLSARSGMSLIHLQGLMGHASIITTRDYIGLSEEDLISAHEKHGPVDRIIG